MIVCPNCQHQNPEGANQCEACYTPLPTTLTCPSCGADVQSDATFCGQCGSSLQVTPAAAEMPPEPDLPATLVTPPAPAVTLNSIESQSPISLGKPVEPESKSTPLSPTVKPSGTLLQQQCAQLVHVQTNTVVELPQTLSVIHVGKPNDLVPPDVDVSGFPSSEVVSRKHADIRVEADGFYLEDMGSSNGTYINNIPLPPGNRHRLRPGDRISLGKGDLVSFIFQMS